MATNEFNKIETIKRRDTKLDSLKFILVCLVIIGHIVGPYKEFSLPNNSPALLLYDILIILFMSLFVKTKMAIFLANPISSKKNKK